MNQQYLRVVELAVRPATGMHPAADAPRKQFAEIIFHAGLAPGDRDLADHIARRRNIGHAAQRAKVLHDTLFPKEGALTGCGICGADDLARRIVGRLRQPVRRRRIPRRRPIAGVEPRDLGQTGWGVVFASDVSPEVREALQPLLDHRRAQAARQRERRFQVYDLAPGESASAFLRRLESSPGPADPDIVPYYLLIVGGPESIPFPFQYQLDVQYGVGRLWFAEPEDYARYAQRLIAAEMETKHPTALREVVFFGPAHPGDEATRLSSEELVAPLSAILPGERRGWTGRPSARPAPRRTIATPGSSVTRRISSPASGSATTMTAR